MMFSVTERGTFKRCERQWRLSSKNGQHLGPIVSPVYLGVGTLIHQGSQQWLLGAINPLTSTKYNYADNVMVAADKMIVRAHERYLAQVGAEMGSAEDDILYESAYFARIMAENYETRWGSALPDGFTLIRPEQRAQIPVPGTEHECEVCLTVTGLVDPACEGCHGTRAMLHHLDMRFDGIIMDRAGNLHVLEHKTYKSRPKEESLAHNDQFLAYMWGARQLGIGRVVGLAYDGLWRRDKVPRGRTFEDLFLRYTHLRPEAEFAEFERLLPWELNEMYDKRPDVRPLETLAINRQWQGCYDCKFNDESGQRGLCTAISRGEDTAFLLKTKYTERSDDTDDDADDGATEAA